MQELMDKKDKKPKKPKKAATTLNSEEAAADSSVSESSDEETEDYDSEDESVDTESSDSSEEEATVITTPQIKGDILAQIEAQSSGHDCTFAHRRNKADLEEYWTIRQGDGSYVDTDFTPDMTALYWSDMGESNQGMNDNDFSWERAGEKFADHSLFGTNGVTAEDVRQGALGNCWFLSAIAALSEEPGRIESIFVENDKTDQGIYAVNFYTLGVPHTVIIDDFLPVRYYSWNDTYTTIFSKMGLDNALWAPLLEKAFAKYHGNYGHIVGGDSRRAARTMSGAPYDSHPHDSHDENSIWNLIVSKDNAKDMIQVNTSGSNNDY